MPFIHLNRSYINVDRIDYVEVLANNTYEVHAGGQQGTILVSPDSDDGKALIKFLMENIVKAE